MRNPALPPPESSPPSGRRTTGDRWTAGAKSAQDHERPGMTAEQRASRHLRDARHRRTATERVRAADMLSTTPPFGRPPSVRQSWTPPDTRRSGSRSPTTTGSERPEASGTAGPIPWPFRGSTRLRQAPTSSSTSTHSTTSRRRLRSPHRGTTARRAVHDLVSVRPTEQIVSAAKDILREGRGPPVRVFRP